MKQKYNSPDYARGMMDKHVSMRDLLALKRFGFEFPASMLTRCKIRTRVIAAIEKYDEDWQQEHSGQAVQQEE